MPQQLFTVRLKKQYVNRDEMDEIRSQYGAIQVEATTQTDAEQQVARQITDLKQPLQTIDPRIKWEKWKWHKLGGTWEYIDFSFQVVEE